MYYYLFCQSVVTKRGMTDAFKGPYGAENEANEKGFQLFPGQMFEVLPFTTRNMASATRMLRSYLSDKRGYSVGETLNPIAHKL